MKHTPGPWRIIPNSEGHMLPFEIAGQKHPDSNHNGHVCNIFIHDDEREPVEHANAKLIAAAPEMLKALRAIGEYAEAHGEIPMILDLVRTVIIKASEDKK